MAGYEVAHGEVRLTLNDRDALDGLRRAEYQFKNTLSRLDRMEATAQLDADLKPLERSLKKAQLDLKKFQALARSGGQGTVTFDGNTMPLDRAIALANKKVGVWEKKVAEKTLQIKGAKEAIEDIEAVAKAEEARYKAAEKYSDEVERNIKREIAANEAQARSVINEGNKVAAFRRRMEAQRTREMRTAESAAHAEQRDRIFGNSEEKVSIAALQQQYAKLARQQQADAKRGGFKRAVSPETRMRFDLDQDHALAEMAVLRAKLEALGAKPIEVPVDMRESGLLKMFAGMSDIAVRIGPFTASLGQLLRVSLILGPALVGVAGGVTALVGALGTGLVGGVGVAAAALLGFGGVLGGVFLAVKPITTHFKEINKASNAYAAQVAKTGKESDKAKKKLAEFNSVTAHMSPNAREAFRALGGLNARWKELTKSSRDDAMEGMAEGVTTLTRLMPMLAANTNVATREVTAGFSDWMKGLRSANGRDVISNIMVRTTNAIDPLMGGLGKLGAFIGKVTASFARHFKPLAEDFENWADGLNKAADNTHNLDGGIDRLVGAFRSTVEWISAASRVVKEFFRGALGAGQSSVDNMADGMNRLADSMGSVEGQRKLNDFFRDSVEMMGQVYDVLQPLAALFLEYATIMRPFASITLTVAAAVADVVQAFADFGPTRSLLVGMFGLWIFKRGTASTIALITGAVNGLASALRGVGAAGAAAKLGALVPSTVVTANRRMPTPIPGRPGMTQGSPLAGTPPRPPVGKLGMAGAGLTALTGLTPPMLALTAAVAGATYGIVKWKNAIDSRRKRDEEIESKTGVDVGPRRTSERNFSSRYDFGNDPKLREQGSAAVKSINDVNNASRQSGQIQRALADTYSQVANSHLQVKQAEVAYKDTVKASGKNSLEAKIAMQQLSDARRADRAAVAAWADQNRIALDWVNRGLHNAKEAYKAAIGTPFENAMRNNLIKARDAAGALKINLDRAKQGLDAFTGQGAEKVARLSRVLDGMGKDRQVRIILRDSETTAEAIRRLRKLLDDTTKEPRTAVLRAKMSEARGTLAALNRLLDTYGDRKPEAILRARDEAKAVVDALNADLDTLNGRTVKPKVNLAVKVTDFSTSPVDALKNGGDGPGAAFSPMGDGTGYRPGSVKNAAKSIIENYAKGRRKTLIESLAFGDAGLGSKGAKGSGLNAFNNVAGRFGVSVGSGFRKGSITSSGNLSYHAMGRARDFPGPASNMMRFARYMAATFGSRLKELIYTPLGYSIKDGKKVAPYAQADHYDHVHVAMRQGGRVGPGKYNKPNVLFAEEPGHSEYFIPTNPRYRARSQALIGQAAQELGLIEHSTPWQSKTSRARQPYMGEGIGYTVNTKRPDKEQQSIIRMAMQVARSLRAGPKATKALLMAIMHESNARNLKGGDKSSSGPLQLLAKTAKGLGISPRNSRDVFEAFLTKGFTGKGSAMKLARNKKLTAAQVAHMVQGNATGVGVYARHGGEAAAAMNNWDMGKGGGKASEPRETPTFGAINNLANRLAIADARVTQATRGTSQRNIVDSIMGKDRPLNIREREAALRRAYAIQQKRRQIGVGMSGAQGDLDARLLPQQRAAAAEAAGVGTVHDPGMIDLLYAQDRTKYRRQRAIKSALKGKLTKGTRDRLLEEQATISTELSGNRDKRADLRKTAAEAQFELGRGALGRTNIDYNSAVAASTETLDDDIETAKAERDYWAAREQWALSRGDKAGATEARNNFNSANQKIKGFEDQSAASADETKAKQRQAARDALAAGEAMAALTPDLQDDATAARNAEAYWSEQLTLAQTLGDNAGIAEAAGALKVARDSLAQANSAITLQPLELRNVAASLTKNLLDDVTIAQDMVAFYQNLYNATSGAEKIAAGQSLAGAQSTLRDATRNVDLLPLESERARAALTDTFDDDKKASEAIRDYWQKQYDVLDSVQGPERDFAAITEAANNLKSARDEVTGVTGNMAQQTLSLNTALKDLYRSYLPNFKPTHGHEVGASKVVNIVNNNNFQTQPDPATWSAGVAWELQSAV